MEQKIVVISRTADAQGVTQDFDRSKLLHLLPEEGGVTIRCPLDTRRPCSGSMTTWATCLVARRRFDEEGSNGPPCHRTFSTAKNLGTLGGETKMAGILLYRGKGRQT